MQILHLYLLFPTIKIVCKPIICIVSDAVAVFVKIARLYYDMCTHIYQIYFKFSLGKLFLGEKKILENMLFQASPGYGSALLETLVRFANNINLS